MNFVRNKSFVLTVFIATLFSSCHSKHVSTPSTTQGDARSNPTGVTWVQKTFSGPPYGNQVVNVLTIDSALVTLRSVRTQYSNQYESVLSMGKRTNALAGVNGGFFCHGSNDICGANPCNAPAQCPVNAVDGLSLLIVSGTQYSTNCAKRTSFGLPSSGPPEINQIGSGQGWPGVNYAIGAGPNLVTNKQKHITQEGFCWYGESAARTAVATTAYARPNSIRRFSRPTSPDGTSIHCARVSTAPPTRSTACVPSRSSSKPTW